MDTAGLRAKAAAYDRNSNEGGEGYNPYTAQLDRLEAAEAAARPMTREERKYAIRHELSVLDCSLARECGTYDAAIVAELRADLDALEAEERAELLAAWPLEVTIARRADWNARVAAKKITTSHEARQAEAAQGWSLADLRGAILAHNLPSK